MQNLSRRTVLRSGSAALLLPFLEAHMSTARAASTPKPPKRLVWVTMGYGVSANNWLPSIKQVGTNYDMPPLMESFEDLRSDFSFVQNLSLARIANAHSGTTNFLTCSKPGKPGVFSNSISCDQVAAKFLGRDTRHSSLAIGGAMSGSDGHGGKRGYASWNDKGKPVGTYRKMLDLYRALFGTGGSADEIKAQLVQKRSSLDLLIGNAKRLNKQISANDRDRVDEYFTSIRNIETRLSKAQEWTKIPFPKAPFSEPADVGGIEEVELAFDMMLAAMQSDSTRVMTYMLPTRSILKSLGLGMNPHQISHKAGNELDPKRPHQMRDRAGAEQVARFIRKLKETKEFDGSSLLDHCLVAYGSGLRQSHSAKNAPLILAGHGGGGLKQGQNLVYESVVTPVANLWLSMMRHAGVEQDSFADSDSVLSEMGFS